MVEHLGLLEIRAMENLFFGRIKIEQKVTQFTNQKKQAVESIHFDKKVWCVVVLSESPSTSKSLISLFTTLSA